MAAKGIAAILFAAGVVFASLVIRQVQYLFLYNVPVNLILIVILILSFGFSGIILTLARRK